MKNKAEEIRISLSQDEQIIEEVTTGITNEEFEFNKQYLLNYLTKIANEDYLLLMCVCDEATQMVDDEINTALMSIGISPDFRHAFRQSYIGIASGGESIYEAFSDNILEYTYVDGGNVFELKSVGYNYSEVNSILINGDEQVSTYNRGLQIVVFNKKLGVVEDNIVFDLYENLSYTNYAPVF